MNVKATRKDAYKLFHDGALALADVSRNGMRLDIAYCEDKLAELETKAKGLREKVHKSKIVKKWKKVYGRRFKLDSNEQLASILFKHLGYKAKIFTEKKREPSAKEEALAQIKDPTVKRIIEIKRLDRGRKKLLGMYREAVDGVMRPIFELHTVRSYRSSGSWPNPQNFDVRNVEMAELIRTAIIPHNPEDQLLEVDYSGIEVSGASWYHKDPNMLDEIANPKRDMHRDMAMRCYLLSKKQMGKRTSKQYSRIRYCGKNKFVFPQFYGDYFGSCAKALWDAARTMKLERADGLSIRKHLKEKGFTTLKRFEGHIEEVENYFWQEKFGVYGQWRDDWYNDYLRKGYVDGLAGFRYVGFMKRNECINYPVQGVAFHCLLWSLTKLNRYFKKHKMLSKIIGQIHDSIIINVAAGEMEAVLAIVQKIMCKDIKKHWPWIITDLEIEAEASNPGESWFKKKEVKLA
jgi:DNA polymerase-1